MKNLNIYKKVSHIETDKNKLVLFLFEELLKSLHIIKSAIADKNIETKVQHINHCLDIFEELKNSLTIIDNDKKSLEMAHYLEGLYNQQILNLYQVSKDSTDKLDEIINVMKGLIEVWNTIIETN